jgi:predicted dehydrogenase
MKPAQLPRIGFLGVGWIGRNRLSALLDAKAAEVVAIADPSPEMRAAAHELIPGAALTSSLDELLSIGLDGIVVSTPSALHSAQCIAALRRGVPVFCQKPLARDGQETAAVLNAAREADRLLAVDFSYRHTRACQALKRMIDDGELGTIYAARFVFHNAYGPDKPWYFDRAQSAGGCLVDLGIHLIDLALWLLPEPVRKARGRLYRDGKLLRPPIREVESYASAALELESGGSVELACSWHLHAGCDAVIEGQVYGTRGGARFYNVNGSFYDFAAERMAGTRRDVLVEPPDAWGGRAIIDWAHRLRETNTFDPQANSILTVARLLDEIAQVELTH